ncbi:MAG: hypothetical protein QNJ51_04730 [Calothrix sp. MO_167.B12]|nr:hypothetical protein [Calothrix sp. MO_167.B12]
MKHSEKLTIKLAKSKRSLTSRPEGECEMNFWKIKVHPLTHVDRRSTRERE